MKKTCFFIGPIGEEKSPTRNWSDQVFTHIVSPVVTSLGYEKPTRSDLIPRNGSITSEIMRHLVLDSIVIADLTEWNPNVFYELAVRHVIERPTINLIRKGDRLPFDVYDIRAIPISITDLSEANNAKEELRSQIVSIENEGAVEIPHIAQVKKYKEILDSSKSENEKKNLFDIYEEIIRIRTDIDEIKDEFLNIGKEYIGSQENLLYSPFVQRRLAKAELIESQLSRKK